MPNSRCASMHGSWPMAICSGASSECVGSYALPLFFWATRGCGLPPAGHTQCNQANPTAGGPRQSLTSEIRLTPLFQEVPSARTKIAWELQCMLCLAQLDCNSA